MATPNLLLPDYSSGINALAAGIREYKQDQRMNRLGALLPEAYSGNQNALASLAQLNPQAYMTVRSDLSEQKRATSKERLGVIRQGLVDAAGTIVNLPEDHLPVAWGGIRTKLVADFPELASRLPEQYTPEVLATARGLAGIKPADPKGPPLENWQNADGSINRELYEAEKGLKTANTQLRIENPTAPGSDPSFQLFYGPNGQAYSFDRRTQKVMPLGVTGAPYDPNQAAAVAAARASGTAQGKAQGEAAVSLPATIQTGEYALDVVDQLLKSPGRTMITGGSSLLGTARIPGTASADAKALLDQINGRAFLEAFESLKGGGQITEVEGQKATQAIARLNTAQTDEAFEAALNELRGVINNGLSNARTKAQAPQPTSPPGGATVLDWSELP